MHFNRTAVRERGNKMELRMVGISTGNEVVTIQARRKKTDSWHQEALSFDRFERFFKTHFPKHYSYYEIAKDNEEWEFEANGFVDFYRNTYDCASWFYNFGETNEIKRKGDAYIFEE